MRVTHRILCQDRREMQRKGRAAVLLFGCLDVQTMVSGTLCAVPGKDLVFATSPVLLKTWGRAEVFCDGVWTRVDLSKSENVKLWLYIEVHSNVLR